MVDTGPLDYRSISEIAERNGVSRQATAKSVKKLIAGGHDLPHQTDGRGRVVKVSLAHFEHLRNNFGNSEKGQLPFQLENGDAEQVQSPADPDLGNLKSRDEANRREAWLTLQRKQLAHNEDMQALVRADTLRLALQIAGREIQREIARLPNRADEIALSVSKEGEHGARSVLSTIADDLGNAIADALQKICDEAPATDPELEDDET